METLIFVAEREGRTVGIGMLGRIDFVKFLRSVTCWGREIIGSTRTVLRRCFCNYFGRMTERLRIIRNEMGEICIEIDHEGEFRKTPN